MWGTAFPEKSVLQQIQNEWHALSQEQKKKMEKLITLSIDIFMIGINEDIKKEMCETNKIFLKLMMQEWFATKEYLKMLGSVVNK